MKMINKIEQRRWYVDLNLMNAKCLSLVLICSCLMFSVVTNAHNKVVVIPMAGDDYVPLKNIVTVAKGNGDFTNPISAMNSITDAAVDNPYLIVIAPGEYSLYAINVGQQLVMKEYVDIVGSGQNTTILRSSRSRSVRTSTAAVVVGADNASITGLTIQNVAAAVGSTYAIGVYNAGVSPEISDSTISVTANRPFHYGVYNVNTAGAVAAPKLSNLKIVVKGAGSSQTGILNTEDTGAQVGRGPTLSNLDIEVSGGGGTSYGVYNQESNNSVWISDSRVGGSTLSVRASTGAGLRESYISDSILIGNVTGDPRCGFVFSAFGSLLNSSCQ